MPRKIIPLKTVIKSAGNYMELHARTYEGQNEKNTWIGIYKDKYNSWHWMIEPDTQDQIEEPGMEIYRNDAPYTIWNKKTLEKFYKKRYNKSIYNL